MGGGGSGIACPGFSVLRFRREFLSRMRIPKGNRTRMSGLARFGMDADRGRPAACENQAHSAWKIPGEKSARKTGTGNPAAATPQRTPTRASAYKHNISGWIVMSC